MCFNTWVNFGMLTIMSYSLSIFTIHRCWVDWGSKEIKLSWQNLVLLALGIAIMGYFVWFFVNKYPGCFTFFYR